MPDAGEARSGSRVEALTGIRIVAAAFVFLSHVAVPTFMPKPLHTFAAAGYNGVTLFFILSGFVLAWNYADRMSRWNIRAVRSYAVARLARVYPMYVVALLWAAAPSLLSTGVERSLGLHVFALQTWSPDLSVAYGYNAPGWSIGAEFFLYACFPVAIVLLSRFARTSRALIVVGVASVVLTFALASIFVATGRSVLPWTDPDSAHRWLYRMPLTRLGDFTVGAVAALLIQTRGGRSHRLAGGAQHLGALAFLGLMFVPAFLFTAWSFDAIYLVPTALLIWGLAAAPRTRLARLLGSRPMVLAGEASYAFYLLHLPLLGRLQFADVDSSGEWLVATGLQFGFILLVAIGAQVAIERPARRWLRSALDPRPADGRRSASAEWGRT